MKRWKDVEEECEAMKEKWEKNGRQEVGVVSVLGHANLGEVSPMLRRACKCAHRTNTVAEKGAALSPFSSRGRCGVG